MLAMEARGDPIKYRLRFFLLTLLAIKPSHGYELSKKIEEATRGIIRAGPGSIYPLLRELRDEGLVEEDTIVESGRVKKVYRLTLKGVEEVAKELDIAQDIIKNMLSLVVNARKGVEKVLREGVHEACPPNTLIEGLRSLHKIISEYLEVLEKAYERCRATQGA